jgi:hypothetical protein
VTETDAALVPAIPAPNAFAVFRDAARALKTAEATLKAAQLVYVDALKALSDECCKETP